MIYICTPIAGRDRDPEDVRRRIAELGESLAKRGFDSCSHLDNGCDGKWAQRIGANIALLLSCDGILLDNTRKGSRVCMIEETVAKTIPSWKKGFVFLHTKEEFDYINDNFVV